MKPRYFFILACTIVVSLSHVFAHPLKDEEIKQIKSLKGEKLLSFLGSLNVVGEDQSIVNWETQRELLDLAIQLDSNSQVIINSFVAYRLLNKKKVYEAYKLMHKTRKLLKQQESFALAFYHRVYAEAFSVLHRPDSTIFYANRFLKIAQQTKDNSLIFRALNYLALKHYDFKSYAISIYYRKKIVANYPTPLRRKRFNIHHIGMAYSKLHQYDSARFYLRKSIYLSEKMQDFFWIGLDNGNVGQTYMEEGNYEEALPYLLIDLKFSQLEGVTEATLNCLQDLVHLSVKRNKLNQGRMYFMMLDDAFEDISLSPSVLKEQKLKFYQTASIFYEASKDFQKAYRYHKDYTLLYRELEENKHKVTSSLLAAWSDYENLIKDNQRKESVLKIKEQQILLLKREKQLQTASSQLKNYLLAGAAILLLLSIWILYGLYERYVYNKGARKTLEVQRDEIFLKNSKLSQNLILLEDHQEKLKKLTKHLSELNATKDKLFSIIGHDLRTPIANLRSIVQLLSSRNISQDDFMQVSHNLSQSIEHVFFTLDNLLQWANSQLQGFQAHPQPIDLQDIAQENIDFLIGAAQSKKIIISNHIHKDSLVSIDKNQMNLVFRNLINNAIKFTPVRGSIQVSAQADEKEFKIAIADTGIGISEEAQRKLFKHNIHYSTYGTNGEKGTGLGLLLCEEMLAKNGGSISVKSEPGQGTTFWITLPKLIKAQN